MMKIIVTFADGNTLATQMHADIAGARAYYIGQKFQFGDTDEHPADKMVEAVKVNEIFSYENEDKSAWGRFIKAMQQPEPTAIDEEMLQYWLDVLPPAFMHKTVKLLNGETVTADYGFVEGADRITAFFKRGGYFWCAPTTLISRGR